MPGHPREARARRLANVLNEVAARSCAAGPEEVRRGRATPAGWLRGHEAAGGEDSPDREEAPGRSRRAACAALRGNRPGGRGPRLAGETGRPRGRRGTTEAAA